jgi:hypothetical protein
MDTGKEAIFQKLPLFPIDGSVIQKTENEIRSDRMRVVTLEYTDYDIRSKQMTLRSILGELGGYLDPKKEGEKAKAYYEGACYALRYIRNQGLMHGIKEVPVIPPYMKPTIAEEYRRGIEQSVGKGKIPAHLIFGQLLKKDNLLLYNSLVGISHVGGGKTDDRLKGAIITMYAFKAYYETATLNEKMGVKPE